MNSALVLCAVAMGVAQVVDCRLHLAHKKSHVTTTVFSLVEWAWGVLCLYLLIKAPDEIPVWLSGSFVVYLAGWLVYAVIQMRRGRSSAEFELSRTEALAGGAFGMLYGAAAAVALA